MHQGLECIFDWLQFTIHNWDEQEVIMKVLKLKLADFLELPKGRLGYKKQKACGNISVLYDGSDDMGVHVIISGQGCREFEVFDDILQLLDRIMLFSGKCTRIDMAIDDKTGIIIPFDKIVEAVHLGYISSRWKTSTEYIKRKLIDGYIIGHTVNVGSRKSKMYMRIYDKAMEQGTDTPWIRMELEIKDKRAEMLQTVLLFENKIGQVFTKIINNYIRLLEPRDDLNRSRWSAAAWWNNLVNEVGKLSLTRRPEDKSIEEIRTWVKQQIGPTLALLVLADGGSIDDILKTILEGKSRLKEKHMRILNKAKEPDDKEKGTGTKGFHPV